VRPVTVGIVNSVRTRLDELTPHFGHIVVDECHRCPSSMFTECVRAFDARYLLGLSATPFRRDGLTNRLLKNSQKYRRLS
jgi:superfamily II DNA or RNA helicase